MYIKLANARNILLHVINSDSKKEALRYFDFCHHNRDRRRVSGPKNRQSREISILQY